MTVQELIDALASIEDKTLPVVYMETIHHDVVPIDAAWVWQFQGRTVLKLDRSPLSLGQWVPPGKGE